jgi:hypothetical protein
MSRVLVRAAFFLYIAQASMGLIVGFVLPFLTKHAAN